MTSNSFKNIVLDDLEHIIHNTPVNNGYGKSYEDQPDKNIRVFPYIQELVNYTFTKKYNLIYQNESLTHDSEMKHHIREKTAVIERVLTENTDKFFMIIDEYSFDHFTLKQHSNCQIWPKKYFAGPFGLCFKDTNIQSIKQKRQHWFCSVLGRSDDFRTQMFNWFMDQGLERENKISYLASLSYTKKETVAEQQQNFISTEGKAEYKHLIPFNNFENKEATANIYLPQDGIDIRKPMPLYDCLFNIVVETFPTNGTNFYTEKSLNAILYGHIPVILGGPGIMKKLQDMGMIIPDYIQWSMWDELEVGQLNIDKFGIMQRQLLELFSKHTIEDIAADWHPYAVRNFNKFKDLEQSCAREEREICRWILTATHNVSNPKYQRLY